MGWFGLGRNHFPVEGKTILLTGGSEGMGKSVAQILSRKGANVVIVSRNVKKLEEALEQIKATAARPTQRFQYFSADLSKPGECARIVAEATAWNAGVAPDIVWCCVGAAHPGFFVEVTPDQLRQQMDINYWSQADMAHAILGDWLSPKTLTTGKERHLIFTSSSLAFFSIAGYGPYSPAKTALRSLSDTLSQEVLLYTRDIKVHTVFPGSIRTAGLAAEEQTKPEITKILEKDDPIQTPEEVARKSVLGLEKGEYFVVVNFLAAAMRGCAWGGSPRNNWLVDTLMTWVTSLAWMFIQRDLDGKIVAYGKRHGHPSIYAKNRE